jgi:hypothetical protein
MNFAVNLHSEFDDSQRLFLGVIENWENSKSLSVKVKVLSHGERFKDVKYVTGYKLNVGQP